jgi:hypothetical protein
MGGAIDVQPMNLQEVDPGDSAVSRIKAQLARMATAMAEPEWK